jgi:hypothetical protein
MKDKTERLLDPKNWTDPKTGERYHLYSREGIGYTNVLDWAKKPPKSISRVVYKKWFDKNKRVKEDYVFFNLFWVSTVWLGVDYAFLNGPPLIFESMVFPRGKLSELDMNRYTTETEAKLGHEALVRKWSNPFFVFWHFFYHEGIEDWYYVIKNRIGRLRKK